MEKIAVEYLPVTEILPYDKNPRKNDRAVDVVAKSIQNFGFKVPILIDKNNVIIAGHTRLKAAISLGMQEVPVIWADDLTDDQIKAFRIMDNKSHEYAEWDTDLLKMELEDLKSTNFNLELTGFQDEELSLLMQDFQPGTREEQSNLDERNQITCPSCGHQFQRP